MGTMLSCNVNKVRTATLKGRKYLVANVTLIVPGVLNGSKGALFYPRDEVSHPNNVDAWNGMPLVNGHPTQDGAHVSARSPGVMERFGIGHVYNARINPKTGSLRAQAWFDVESMERVEPRILQALKQGKPVEVSTGLFTHDEPAPQGSVYNGREYQYVARRYRPDHLAILIDQEGACSLRDGCGVMVENSKGGGSGRWVTTDDGNRLFIEGGTAKTGPGGKTVDEGGKGAKDSAEKPAAKKVKKVSMADATKTLRESRQAYQAAKKSGDKAGEKRHGDMVNKYEDLLFGKAEKFKDAALGKKAALNPPSAGSTKSVEQPKGKLVTPDGQDATRDLMEQQGKDTADYDRQTGFKSKHDGTEYQNKSDRDSDDRHFDKKKAEATKAQGTVDRLKSKLERVKARGPKTTPKIEQLKGRLAGVNDRLEGLRGDLKGSQDKSAALKSQLPQVAKTISDEDWDKNVAGLEKSRKEYREARKAGKKGEARSRLNDARRFRKTLIGNAATVQRRAQLIVLNCGGPGSGVPGPCPEGKTVAGIPVTIKPMGTGQESAEYTTARQAAFSASAKARDASYDTPAGTGGDATKFANAAVVASKLANGGGKSLPGRTLHGRHSSLHKKAASAHTKTADAHRSASSQYAISRPDASLKHAKAAEAHSAAATAHTKAGHELMIVGNRTLNRSTNGGRTMAAKILTKKDAVQFLTANCDCWKAKGAKTTLNALPDETLNSLVASEQLATAVRNRLGERAATLTVNQLAESLADPEVELELIEDELAENCDMGGGEMEETEEAEGTEAEEAAPPPFAKKKLKKKGPPMAPPTGNAAATPQRMTMEQWTAIAPLEVIERDARAKQVVNGERDRIVSKLVANSAARTKDQKDQLRKTLNTKTLDDLNLMALLQVNRKAVPGDTERAASVPNYGGLGHSYEEPVFNEGVNEDGSITDDDGMLVHNTASVKWADEVKLYAPAKKAM